MLTLLQENIKKTLESLHPKGIIAAKYKLIYFAIPKVASSSIKKFFIDQDVVKTYIENKDRVDYIHEHVFPTVKQQELYKYNDFIKFTVVRHPVDRIYSCYKDKILTRHARGLELYNGFKRYNQISKMKLFKSTMSFRDFIKSLTFIPDTFSDEHFRSQYRFLPHSKSKLHIDRLLKLEDLPEALNVLFEEVGLDFSKSYHMHPTKKLSNAIEIDSKTKKMIEKRYYKDFRILNYN